ncbi:MAG: hypothetical protein JF887_04755 [Candidatus Dormibacteraeota bacterium]|uniref:VCBS repeat-containing protein n=1 Tax=Candidatus Amunia macphersoniae TaxID=3127014 RepID=A0A934KFU3_9BACT|nr:hypothetical protein [Candidatus Dormibacteraeota bacterium]
MNFLLKRPAIRTVFLALAATVASGAALVTPAQHAAADNTYGVVGYDISWPQCMQAMPAPSFDIAIIGINDGHGFSGNPCINSELQWSRQASLPADVYINADYTQTTPSQGANGPAGQCAPSDLNCYGYNYGWNNAQYSLNYASANGVTAQVWWLDVETTNYWATNDDGSYNNPANASAIQGGIDALRVAGKTAGTYSTRYQWSLIAGSSYRPQVPVWYAGASDVNQAAAFCSQSNSFTGGPVWLTQFPLNGYDGDYACTTQTGWGALVGIHFASLDTAARGSAAIGINDNRVYARNPSGSSFGALATWSSTPFFGSRSTSFANLQGPGRAASAVAINDSSIWVMLNSGTTLGAPQRWSAVPFFGSRATVMADVDGSGRESAVAINDFSVWVMLNNGSGFDPPTQWSSAQFYGSQGTYAAVVDGSHRASLIAINDAGIWVLPNLGGSFGPPQPWAGSRFFGTRGTFVADIDGSGRASAVAINDSGIWVESNTGAGGFAAPQRWATGDFYSSWAYVADVDGSGRASAIVAGPGGIWVRRNLGGAFGAPEHWFPEPFDGTH